MGEFTEDSAFRALLVIGLFGLLFWSTYGHAIGYYEDSVSPSLSEKYGALAFDEGFRMAHLHSMTNSLVALAASIALPLITSIKRRLKTALAAVFGLSLILWNTAYLIAALTEAAPTDDAFEAAKTNALNWFGIPLSFVASLVGLVLFAALLYDLARKKPIKT